MKKMLERYINCLFAYVFYVKFNRFLHFSFKIVYMYIYIEMYYPTITT